jgi:hypothetical protein
MSKLVQETLLKPDLIKNIVPPLLNEIKVVPLLFDVLSIAVSCVEKLVGGGRPFALFTSRFSVIRY